MVTEFVKIMGSSIYKKKSDDDIIAEFKVLNLFILPLEVIFVLLIKDV